jgi:hypothetical protein
MVRARTGLRKILLVALAFLALGCTPKFNSPAKLKIPALTVPAITSIVPPIGPQVGGTAVTITGTNFMPGATVTIGGDACTGIVVVSMTTITCTTPAHSSGGVPVLVTDPDKQDAGTTFTYYIAGLDVPGFAITLGGGVTTKAAGGPAHLGITAYTAIGEPPSAWTPQVGPDGGNGVSVKNGIVNSNSTLY